MILTPPQSKNNSCALGFALFSLSEQFLPNDDYIHKDYSAVFHSWNVNRWRMLDSILNNGSCCRRLNCSAFVGWPHMLPLSVVIFACLTRCVLKWLCDDGVRTKFLVFQLLKVKKGLKGVWEHISDYYCHMGSECYLPSATGERSPS